VLGAGAALAGIVILRLALQQLPGPGPAAPAQAPVATAASLQLMSPFGPASAGPMVALGDGLFDGKNLHLDLRAGDNAEAPISAVVAGSATFGVTRADTFLVARASDSPIVAFASGFVESPAAFYILKSSGLLTPANFSGHSIGHRVGDDTSIIYDALVSRLGLPSSKISEFPVTDDVSMLVRGDVDIWPGHIGQDDYALRQLGADYLVINPASYGIDFPGTVYFASARTITERPDLVQRFLEGVIAGWDRVYQDYAKSVPVIVSFDTKRLTPAGVIFALDRQREYLRPGAVRYGEFHDTGWNALQSVLLQQRLMSQTVDLQAAINYDFLRDAYRKSPAFGQ
jgi:ABC-type nitrate/sulfonate/bicarbonate transport system substrate-binding protein